MRKEMFVTEEMLHIRAPSLINLDPVDVIF